jgi:hypothetical protein
MGSLGLVHAQVTSIATSDCRIVFDMGSSGVRVAASSMAEGSQTHTRDIDLLTPLMQGQGLAPLLERVEAALRELPQAAKLPSTCLQIGGGFSAWRFAWAQDSALLVRQLAELREKTGVAVLIIPVSVEGRYGLESAQQALKSRLATTHIFDMGGGSLQVASHDRASGIELGQKSWSRLLCQKLRREGGATCSLLPLLGSELEQARNLVDQQLKELPNEAGTGTLTAISRPVTRGIRAALNGFGMSKDEVITLSELGWAIGQLSARPLAELVELTKLPVNFAQFLVSDMLLVEGVLRAMGLSSFWLVETPVNILPGILRDERAFEWARHHACYLELLSKAGPSVYFSDPAQCANIAKP